MKIGTAARLKAAIVESEDSETLNTSFIERLNLTIRQASAYLRRRSPCHAALLRKSKLAPSAPTRRFVTDRSRTTLVDQARSFD